MVMEFVSGGNLRDLLLEAKGTINIVDLIDM